MSILFGAESFIHPMNKSVRIVGDVPPDDFGKHLAVVCAAHQATVERIAAAEWSLHGAVDRYELLRALLPWARNEGAIVHLSCTERPARAFLFDLDATLTACEFLDTLADELGIGAQTRELTRTAMNGTLDFATSYRTRLQLLAGTPLDRIEALIARLPLAQGAEALCEALHRRALPTAIVTGGYARVGRAVQQRLGIGTLYATELEERDGRLTGRILGPLLDDAAKVDALDDFCARNGCEREDCAAVGDGANDLRMLAAAGHAVLYSALSDHPSKRITAIDFCERLLNS